MRKKAIIIRIMLIAAYAAFMPLFFASAGEYMPFDPPQQGPTNNITPEDLDNKEKALIEEVSLKSIIEQYGSDLKKVEYNKDGTISKVELNNGEVISYSYKYDSNEKLESCVMEGKKVVLILKVENNGSGDQKPPPLDHDYYGEKAVIYINISDKEDEDKDGNGGNDGDKANGKDGDNGPGPVGEAGTGSDGAVKRHMLTLEDVSSDPAALDLKGITEAVEKAGAVKEEAEKKYRQSTSRYYAAIESELIKLGLVKGGKEGADVQNAAYDARRRADLDEAVAAAINVSGDTYSKKFEIFEKMLREETLIPAIKEYEDELEGVQKDIEAMIDGLIKSRLAVLCESRKGKIEVVIKLPPLKDE